MSVEDALKFAAWFSHKVRQRALDAQLAGGDVYEGVRQSAKNLRKQDVPIEHTLAILRRPL